MARWEEPCLHTRRAQTMALQRQQVRAGRTQQRSHPGCAFQPQGPRNFLGSGSGILQQRKFRLRCDGFSASGLRGSFLTREPRALATAPSPSWASLLVSECPEPTSVLGPKGISVASTSVPLWQLLGTAGRYSPSPLLYRILQKVTSQLKRL